MKKNIYLLAFIFSIAFLSSCQKKATANFDVKQSEFAFTADGGEEKIEVVSSEFWTATTSEPWCSVSPANGNSSAVCVVRVDSSYLYSDREAIVTFYTNSQQKKVKISQFGYQKVIKIDKDDLKIPASAVYKENFVDIKVSSNIDYDFEINSPQGSTGWISVKTETKVQTEAIARTKIYRITYLTNTEPEVRSANIIFKGKGEDASIVSSVIVNQEAAVRIISNTREGDSLALISITQGLNCYPGWDLSRSMMHWNGVLTDEIEFVNPITGRDTTDLRVVGLSLSLFNTKETLPYQIKYLTELKTLVLLGNANAFLCEIELLPDVTELKKLESLAIQGYGISSLPVEMKNMTSLKELFLGGNTFLEVPIDIIKSIPNLEALDMAGCRRKEFSDLSNVGSSVKDKIGLAGAFPKELLEQTNLVYLSLSYNYFEGELPATLSNQQEFMKRKLKRLAVNLNRFTGDVPTWISQHPYVICLDPYILVFNQEGKNSAGVAAGFNNIPSSFTDKDGQPIKNCPLFDKNSTLSLGEKTAFEIEYMQTDKYDVMLYKHLSLRGNWTKSR